MRRTIAVVFSTLAVLSVVVGYIAGMGPSSGPLNYIFVVILGFPWTLILSWLFPSAASPLIPAIGLLINLALVWWWALRGTRKG